MAMSVQTGGGHGPSPDINITPLVDVVLVLLIIFMVIAPMLTPDLDIALPSEPDETEAPPPTEHETIVVDVAANGAFEINGRAVARSEAEATLRRLLTSTPDRVVFVRVNDDAMFRDAIAAMDLAHGAGAEQVGTVLDTPAPTGLAPRAQ